MIPDVIPIAMATNPTWLQSKMIKSDKRPLELLAGMGCEYVHGNVKIPMVNNAPPLQEKKRKFFIEAFDKCCKFNL